MMKYYLLDLLKRQDREYCYVANVPQEVLTESNRISLGKTISDIYPTNAKVYMSEDDDQKLSDSISNSSSMMLISNKYTDIIKSLNNVDTEYLPVSIIDHNGNCASSDYFIVNPIGNYDVLDLEKSNIRWFKGKVGGRVIKVYECVLSSEKLTNIPHLFRIKESRNSYVISEELLNATKEAGLTNINVKELEIASATSEKRNSIPVLSEKPTKMEPPLLNTGPVIDTYIESSVNNSGIKIATWETVDNTIKDNIFSYIKDTTVGLIEISPDEFKRARDTKNKFDETFGNCWEMYVSPTVMNLLEENDIPLEDFDYGEDVETYAGCGPIYDKFREFFYEFIENEVKKL